MSKISELTQQEILQYAIENGIIDVTYVQEKIIMQKRKEFLDEHPYKIWEGKNGKWYTYLLEDGKKRSLKKRKTKEEIEELIISYYSVSNASPTIQSTFDEWTLVKLEFEEICQGTYDRYLADFNKFFKTSKLYEIYMIDVTEEDLEYFVKKTISSSHLTAKCFSNVRTILNGLFKFGKKKGYTNISITGFFGDLDLSNKMFSKSIRNDESQVFTEDEIPLIIKDLKNKPTIENLGIVLAFQTGVRVGELASLKPSDINGNVIHIQRTEIRYRDPVTKKHIFDVKNFPKSDAGDRYVIVTTSAINTVESIKKLNPNGEYLFEKNSKRVLASALNKRIIWACERLNICKRSSHKIRKTYGTTLINSNVDESFVIEQMGHSDIKTTKEYYYFSNRNKQKKEKQIGKAISF